MVDGAAGEPQGGRAFVIKGQMGVAPTIGIHQLVYQHLLPDMELENLSSAARLIQHEGLFDRRLGIGDMLLVEVDVIRVEPL